jgi:anionic cell wall polymer biosynthesis LytR-Cps2A-Psr (LCP) family protein
VPSTPSSAPRPSGRADQVRTDRPGPPPAPPLRPGPLPSTPLRPTPQRPTPVRPVPVVPAVSVTARATTGSATHVSPPVPARPVAPAPGADTPRWVPGLDRPAVPGAPPRSAVAPPEVPRRVGPYDRPVLPVAPAPARRLTPIEEQFGGTAHPSLPLPDRAVRLSMPVPPLPGLRPPAAPGAHYPAGSGATSAGLAPLRAPVGPVRRRLTRIAVALVVLLGLIASFYVGLYFYVDRSIGRVDALVTDGPEVLASELQDAAETYLVVGTGLPGRAGPASVSTLIAHVSDDGDRAVLVAVPPTALADTPGCRAADGSLRQPVTEPFAAALLDGGPSCLVRSVQQMSGLRVDHYLGLDLGALPGLVDVLGGVDVCLPTAVTAAGGGTLPAGPGLLSGSDVTTLLGPAAGGADVVGTTSAAHEQRVLTSTLESALSAGTLADPVELTRFLTRAADAFTVDADTTLGDVRTLGATLGELSADAFERSGVPVARIGYVAAGTDQATTLIDGAGARAMFDAVIDEGRLPAAEAGPVDPAAAEVPEAPADPALASPVPPGTLVTVPPAGVTVDVLDATGSGRAAGTAASLAAAGFRTGVVATEPAAVDQTVVRHAAAALEPARTVAAAVPGAVLMETEQVAGGVQLVLGPGDPVVAPVAVGTPVPEAAAPAPEAAAPASCG